VPGSPIRFAFYDLLHEPGSKTVLGERYDEDGAKEGERVIRKLCRHPSTARFVARKLVTHFVSDDPPSAAVERAASAFRSSDGDLKVVARALVDEPEAWRDDTRKFRTPQTGWSQCSVPSMPQKSVRMCRRSCASSGSRYGRRRRPRAMATPPRNGRTPIRC
jgi:uncharacterized protein (DUF1800 family)